MNFIFLDVKWFKKKNALQRWSKSVKQYRSWIANRLKNLHVLRSKNQFARSTVIESVGKFRTQNVAWYQRLSAEMFKKQSELTSLLTKWYYSIKNF